MGPPVIHEGPEGPPAPSKGGSGACLPCHTAEKAGRISASTILRRLGTYSRKSRLYQAFSELGRVLRTGFLLRFISDQQLRSTIQGATNKSVALDRFLKWTFFGGEGIITENSRDEQRK